MVGRALLLPAAFGMLYPGWTTTAVGMALLAGITVKSYADARRTAKTRPAATDGEGAP